MNKKDIKDLLLWIFFKTPVSDFKRKKLLSNENSDNSGNMEHDNLSLDKNEGQITEHTENEKLYPIHYDGTRPLNAIEPISNINNNNKNSVSKGIATHENQALIFCTKCGKSNNPQAKFCASCGNAII